MVRRSPLLRAFTLIVAARVASAQTEPPELIAYPSLVLYNGKILTVDAQSPWPRRWPSATAHSSPSAPTIRSSA
jgi:hypothetical protein